MSDQSTDLSELREALGAVFASYTYIYDPFAAIKEIDVAISMESAMLDSMGRFDLPVDKEGNTYRTLFKSFRSSWGEAVQKYNSLGAWKDSLVMCATLRDHLYRIAVKENLLSVSRDMYDISKAGVGGLGFAEEGEGAGETPGVGPGPGPGPGPGGPGGGPSDAPVGGATPPRRRGKR